MRTLLLLDDSGLFRRSVADTLKGRFRILEADSCARAQDWINSEAIDIAILDERLPDGSGLRVCRSLLQNHPFAKVIWATAFPSFEHAVGALKEGAHDYLSKPFDLAELQHALDRLLTFSALEKASRLEAWRTQGDLQRASLVGNSPAMVEVRRVVDVAAASEATVLITGETGTGKNLVASCIHYASPRTKAPFVALNCSALPENLIEAELFGWTKGAFTGAVASREGVLEMADGGTLFLDEIGEMPIHLQVKLLSVLEDRVVTPLGSRLRKQVDVRIIAATNADLEASVQAHRFRSDLYFRLNVLRINLPPLRDHLEDLPTLCDHLQSKLSLPTPPNPLTPGELACLQAYPWPGNVRELRNVLERSHLLRTPPSFHVWGTPTPRAADDHISQASLLSMEDMERRHIREALSAHDGNITLAAKALGISRSTLKRKMGGVVQIEPPDPN